MAKATIRVSTFIIEMFGDGTNEDEFIDSLDLEQLGEFALGYIKILNAEYDPVEDDEEDEDESEGESSKK